VDAHDGRPVTSLGPVLAERLQRGPAPRVVVAALGANARPGWDAVAGYREMIAQLPPTTTVVFVSVYRDPRYYTRRVARHRPDWNPKYSVAYTRAMDQVASERPHTCVAPWRPWARAHHGNLTGGVHPHGYGRRAWARIIARAVASCP
jgi:lysophospholipase L1-like esterase